MVRQQAIITIGQLAAQRRVVYYPSLGYMSPSDLILGVESRDAVRGRVGGHLRDLRVLSQFFDHVLIPLSHLLARRTPGLRDEVEGVLLHGDFAALLQRLVLVATAWDADAQAARRSRQDLLRDLDAFVDYPISPRAAQVVDQIQVVRRDVQRQSRTLASDVRWFLDERGAMYGADAAAQLESIWREATGSDRLPFVHEVFAARLGDLGLAPARKRRVVRETNAWYFQAGQLGNPGVELFADDRLEHSAETRMSGRVPQWVYHPDVLRAVIRVCLTPNASAYVASADLGELLDLRDERWRAFVGWYHERVVPGLASSLPSGGLRRLRRSERAADDLVWRAVARAFPPRLRPGSELLEAWLDAVRPEGRLPGVLRGFVRLMPSPDDPRVRAALAQKIVRLNCSAGARYLQEIELRAAADG